MGQAVEGPFTREQILELRARGACDASTLVHRSGWSEWRSLESIVLLLGNEQARRTVPARARQPSSTEQVLARMRFAFATLQATFDDAISGNLNTVRSHLAKLASLGPSARLVERIGERLRARAEGLHPEVLLGFAVLGLMTVIGNLTGLILVAVTAPLAVQAQAALPERLELSQAAIAPLAAPSAGLVLGARGLPDLPSRDQVLEALSGSWAAVAKCSGRGTARVSLNVRGDSGRISRVAVAGVAPKSRACVARALRRTVFPKFQQANLRVRVPFKLEQP